MSSSLSTFKLDSLETSALEREFNFIESELSKTYDRMKTLAADSFGGLDLPQWENCDTAFYDYEKNYVRYERQARRLGRAADNYFPEHLDDLRSIWRKAGTSPALMREAHIHMIERLLPYLTSKSSSGNRVLDGVLNRQYLVMVKSIFTSNPSVSIRLRLNLRVFQGETHSVFQLPSALIRPYLGRSAVETILVSDLNASKRETLLALFGGDAFTTLKAAKAAALAL